MMICHAVTCFGCGHGLLLAAAHLLLLAYSGDLHKRLTRFALGDGIQYLLALKYDTPILIRLLQMSKIVLGAAAADSTIGHDLPPVGANDLNSLFGDLPDLVKFADYHFANIAGAVPILSILAPLDVEGQTRHFMRDTRRDSPLEACLTSKKYIWDMLCRAWNLMHGGLQSVWTDRSAGTQFRSGIGYLAKALHCIEDSYAVGHVGRDNQETILEVHAWDADNRNASGRWRGHGYYDDGKGDDGNEDPMVARALTAVREFIHVIFENFDEEESAFTAKCAIVWRKHFREAINDNPYSDEYKFPFDPARKDRTNKLRDLYT